jgi:hypothetical protein
MIRLECLKAVIRVFFEQSRTPPSTLLCFSTMQERRSKHLHIFGSLQKGPALSFRRFQLLPIAYTPPLQKGRLL